jgi:opacity protein-like surface antigen
MGLRSISNDEGSNMTLFANQKAILLALAFAAAMPTLAVADDTAPWSGLSVGLGIDVGQNGKPDIQSSNLLALKWDATATLATLSAGYSWQNGPFVFGVEGSYTPGAYKSRPTLTDGAFRYDADIGFKDTRSLGVRVGLTPTSNTLVFLTAAATQAELSANLTLVAPTVIGPLSPFAAVRKTADTSGVTLGGGGAFAFNDDVSVRLDVSQTQYDDFRFVQKTPGSSDQNLSAKPKIDNVRVTLNYNF